MLKENVPFSWGQRAQEAFNKLKKAPLSSPVLAHPGLAKPFIVECGASVGFGAVLLQKDADN